MRVFRILFFLCLASLSLSGCLTTPSAFTNENVMKVHQGMSSDDVLELFGQPQNIDVGVCGKSPNTWTCTTWEYVGFFDETADFTFSGKHGSLKLNNFN